MWDDPIPSFKDNSHTLGIFMNNCENLINTYYNQTNQTLYNFIYRAIMGKLKDKALTLIGSRIELQSWNDIKDASKFWRSTKHRLPGIGFNCLATK